LQRWDSVVGEIFDVVVSNPPYIASEEIDGLDPEVRLHDPHLALDGGQDGLDAYRSLARLLPVWLKSSGLAAFEIGATQGPAVTGVLAAAGLKNISVVKDFSALDRVVIAHCG
jgi:release factor glutamine methyltransferase